jgi:hypothetical protein
VIRRVSSTAGADEGAAAVAAPVANGNGEPASAAGSEPESGEIEGEVGGDAAVGSAPAENGLKPETGSDHKRCMSPKLGLIGSKEFSAGPAQHPKACIRSQPSRPWH